MAERRMFAKTIIDSDAFLDMPLSTQALYFHLSMRADDDGFINKPKTIMRMCSCTNDDIKLLCAKKFLIPFDSGVVVIKHWKIHNYIAKDRYTETKYKVEKSTLSLDENNSYTECIQDVDELETQVRLGKVRLGKVREDKDIIDYDGIINAYNTICKSFPKCKTLSEARKKAIKARLKTYKKEDIKRAFELAECSDFLKGKNNRDWCANIDWMLKDANLAKILDGNYNNRESKNGSDRLDWIDTI